MIAKNEVPSMLRLDCTGRIFVSMFKCWVFGVAEQPDCSECSVLYVFSGEV